MKKNKQRLFHALFFLLITFFLSSLQSVLWYQFFGTLAAPFFSFIVFVYFALEKDSWKSLIYCYGIVYFYSFFTSTSLGLLYMASMVSFIYLFFVKNRVYWPGPAYFTIMNLSSLIIFHLSYILSSLVLEDKFTPLMMGTRILQILLTSLISYFMYNPIKKIDTFFRIDTVSEIHGENHG